MERRERVEGSVPTRIGQAVMLLHGGDREEARNRFGELWAEIAECGEPLHRCTLAHYMADTQDDPGDELAWDLRALTAAEGPSSTARTSPPSPELRAFYPSLHLNLAADYLKLHRPDTARLHLSLAREAAHALGDDGDAAPGREDAYGDGVRAAIRRLERRLLEE
ncbi:hypothetical protein OG875_27815 [Streptomyces sp. NBC_01498]|uniref:hypothetical protein n=1 Tax=Streptomyces sp. NBC_01498 TaxID=2975870 RepID=UPI002E7B5FB8|nr:hypothetical protein [Streptomyces sp. NBC_01498]WTL28046.1 hypothetical protein OG875_27815 [Streptomyces sp. NBC_01498]